MTWKQSPDLGHCTWRKSVPGFDPRFRADPGFVHCKLGQKGGAHGQPYHESLWAVSNGEQEGGEHRWIIQSGDIPLTQLSDEGQLL